MSFLQCHACDFGEAIFDILVLLGMSAVEG